MKRKDTPVFSSGGRSNYRIPSVVADRNGTFYAFCNDRRDSLSDAAGEVWLTFARKKPGEEWEEPRVLAGVPGWACTMGSAVYDAGTDTVMCCGEKVPFQRNEFGRYSKEQLAEMAAESERRVKERGIRPGRFILSSRDGGETWEDKEHRILPAEFTHWDGTRIRFEGSCHGSAHGITLRHGPHAGRLVCPSRVAAGPYANWDELRISVYNNALYSDDHGLTWQASGPVQLGTGEGALIENADGSLTYNSRAYFRDGKRYLAASRDGGATWGDFRTDPFLIEETFCGCNASFLRIERGELAPDDAALLPPDAEGLTLFANPRAEKRVNMSVCYSFDGGKTWSGAKTAFAGPSSYSSLEYSAAAGCFVLLYEWGREDPCDGGVAAAEFDLAWLLN